MSLNATHCLPLFSNKVKYDLSCWLFHFLSNFAIGIYIFCAETSRLNCFYNYSAFVSPAWYFFPWKHSVLYTQSFVLHSCFSPTSEHPRVAEVERGLWRPRSIIPPAQGRGSQSSAQTKVVSQRKLSKKCLSRKEIKQEKTEPAVPGYPWERHRGWNWVRVQDWNVSLPSCQHWTAQKCP